ncbi:putative ABC transport system permease protein [Parabacteroides sp. PH5-13]|uniref:ABC transporter permease n=1 Tax=unclassified Parabacteroides TaxID=2649774 RepID=UPI002474B02C|nr:MULTISPECIES: ABC transporter permease [unclassified Parabacteroides]MDH6303526.1 putative ABC transport system permease protein [Parabacteroides sp. PH5-39]MDH6318185.1 putative ABC transport system permease protein [Parabacteroides sp. PH5-13]MDH6321883.1 putative ABC transport system permease protein [Parabacteroides sp. PH5-8]MDH6383024.1 putative ABC transport system permease protein [Parabacteroides sp. PH5-17]MDH6392374.1 putative ABC transport system permease protein [Parabacteroide
MFDIDRWIEIWVTITRNKTRSLLTCFGVFWGILMLVILLGSGTGMKNGIMGNFKGFATNSLFFYTDRTSEAYKGFNKGRWWNMRNRDIESIVDQVEGVEDISPIIWGNRSDKNVVFGQLTGTYNVKGVLPDYFNIETQELFYGRLLNDVDIRDKRKVCLIGSKVNEVLFRNQNSCGNYVRVNGLCYQVVGVVKARSSNINIGGRSEESVFLPFSTMQQTLNQGDILHFLCVSVKRGVPVQVVIDGITSILKAQNEIAPTDPQAVGTVNLAAQFATFEMLFTGIDILVWLVGMGTLLAGIIGVSNIMMVTVKERTKEIGVRRALGAKPFNIISQVMSESLVLTSLAGLLGLSLGVFLLDVVNKVLSAQPPSGDGTFFENPEVSIQTAVAATIVLLFSGLLAGLIPAWRAMQIKAIDAIREE